MKLPKVPVTHPTFDDYCVARSIKSKTIVKASGESAANVSNWRSGDVMPERRKAVKVAAALGIAEDYVFDLFAATRDAKRDKPGQYAIRLMAALLDVLDESPLLPPVVRESLLTVARRAQRIGKPKFKISYDPHLLVG